MNETKRICHNVREKLRDMTRLNEPMDTASWNQEEGVLMTGNDVKVLCHAASAVPDLLEALEKLLQAYREELRGQAYLPNPLDWFIDVQRAEQAINKAKGIE